VQADTVPVSGDICNGAVGRDCSDPPPLIAVTIYLSEKVLMSG
jgi:hypothetical protein